MSKQNLPFLLSSFIGRQSQLAHVKTLLNQQRLVTLIGPGGCGKTRLALATAAEEMCAYLHTHLT